MNTEQIRLCPGLTQKGKITAIAVALLSDIGKVTTSEIKKNDNRVMAWFDACGLPDESITDSEIISQLKAFERRCA